MINIEKYELWCKSNNLYDKKNEKETFFRYLNSIENKVDSKKIDVAAFFNDKYGKDKMHGGVFGFVIDDANTLNPKLSLFGSGGYTPMSSLRALLDLINTMVFDDKYDIDIMHTDMDVIEFAYEVIETLFKSYDKN